MEADIAQRHLSFLESGRSKPSRAMVLRLGEHLDLPLRERNNLLLAAGFAPVYEELNWETQQLKSVQSLIERFLELQSPFPALAFDRHWNIQFANSAVHALLDGVDADLLSPPVNILRVTLSRRGLAPRIVNYQEWTGHLLLRLQDQLHRTQDVRIAEMIEEARAQGVRAANAPSQTAPLILPLRLRVADSVLSLLSTTTVFGSAGEVSLSELTIESFVPVDEQTAVSLESLHVRRKR